MHSNGIHITGLWIFGHFISSPPCASDEDRLHLLCHHVEKICFIVDLYYPIFALPLLCI